MLDRRNLLTQLFDSRLRSRVLCLGSSGCKFIAAVGQLVHTLVSLRETGDLRLSLRAHLLLSLQLSSQRHRDASFLSGFRQLQPELLNASLVRRFLGLSGRSSELITLPCLLVQVCQLCCAAGQGIIPAGLDLIELVVQAFDFSIRLGRSQRGTRSFFFELGLTLAEKAVDGLSCGNQRGLCQSLRSFQLFAISLSLCQSLRQLIHLQRKSFIVC